LASTVKVCELLVCLLSEPVYKEQDCSLQDKENHQNDKQLGKFFCQKINRVIMKISCDDAEDMFVLRSQG
jgi:hypothetical protein